MHEPEILDTAEEVARRLGKGVRTIYRWKSRGMPVTADGRYDMAAIGAWLNIKKGLVPPGQEPAVAMGRGESPACGIAGQPDASVRPGSGAQDKDWWDKENKKYQAGLRELELRRRRGELIEVSRVQDEFVARILAVKAGLLAHERSLPPELIACRTEREMADVIRKAVRALLREFARPLPPDMQPGDPNDST